MNLKEVMSKIMVGEFMWKIFPHPLFKMYLNTVYVHHVHSICTHLMHNNQDNNLQTLYGGRFMPSAIHIGW